MLRRFEIAFVALALGCSCNHASPPSSTSRPTSPPPGSAAPVAAEQCQTVAPCHGLEGLHCGPIVACTEIYMAGDFCRQYVRCVAEAGTCRLDEDPRFATCKACMDACGEDKFGCEERCRQTLAAP
jgi:hypothetical protein